MEDHYFVVSLDYIVTTCLKKIKLKTNLKMKYGKVLGENRQDGVVIPRMENSELKNISSYKNVCIGPVRRQEET